MNETKNWYIAYTRPGQEKKVTETLNRKKIECYCPLNSTAHQPFYRRKTIPEVLFCCYSFVRISENQIAALQEVNGIIGLVYWLNKPFIVPDHEISLIREFLDEYRTATVEKIGKDQKVKFPDKVLAGNKDNGIYVRNNTARVILPSLGYAMAAETITPTIELHVPPLLPRLRSIMDKIVG